jgi:hypothetical protein
MRPTQEIESEFTKLFKDIKLSLEYDELSKQNWNQEEFESMVEEVSWQSFLVGLRVSRLHEAIFKLTCSHCTNSITETPDGELISFDLAIKQEEWAYDYDAETWTCPDCKE